MRAKIEWTSVESALPESSDAILVYGRPKSIYLPVVCEGYYMKNYGWFSAHTDLYGDPIPVYGVSHWVEMPSPPAHQPLEKV